MKKILFLFFILTITAFSQNLQFETVAVDSLEDSIYVDLGVDLDYLQYEYNFGTETRAIGVILDGTWTNDSLQVFAAMTETGTYYPLYYDDALVYLVGTTGTSWIALKPVEFAGLRYILFKLPGQEADSRTMYVVKRRY